MSLLKVVPGTSQVRWYSSRGSQQMTSKSSASAICASTRDSCPAPTISSRQRGPNSARSRVPSNSNFSPRAAVSHRHRAAVELQRARHQFVPRGARQHLVDPVDGEQRLLHQAQVAAAGQAEARRLFLGDAVGDERGLVDTLAVAHALDQVVLDAAARHRADHQAVAAQAQQRAGRARRRAPGFDDRDQPHLVALR